MGKPRTKRRGKKEAETPTNEDLNPFDPNADVIYFDDANFEDNGSDSEHVGIGSEEGTSSANIQAAFYGLLDKDETEYFKTAESTLSVNALLNDEKHLFVASVFKEAKGKELKLATSQIGSKLIERLVLFADDQQLIDLFQAFSGHFYKLSLQKYSSHCLETLLTRFAGLVDRELLGTMKFENDQVNVSSPESLVLQLVSELRPHVSQMAKNVYSSHVLRTVLLLLGGEPMTDDNSMRSRKSKMARKHTELTATPEAGALLVKRRVPSTFEPAIKGLVKIILSDLDATSARRMSLDPLGSPLLQVVLQVSPTKSCQKLLDLILKGDGAGSLWEHMLSNVTGSHFLRSALKNASTKNANEFCSAYFIGRIPKLAIREHSANSIRDLLQSKCTEKEAIIREILTCAKEVVAAEQSSLLTTALETASELKNHSTLRVDLAQAVFAAIGDVKLLLNNSSPAQVALTGAVLSADSNLLNEFGETLCTLTSEQLKAMALSPTQSRIIQTALKPQMSLMTRRRLINLFVPLVRELCTDANGSHIVDDLWLFSYKLKFVRERIAAELCKGEETVKASAYGRLVWRNWKLEKYVRKRFEWWNLVKDSEDLQKSIMAEAETETTAKEEPTPSFAKVQLPKAKKPYDRLHK